MLTRRVLPMLILASTMAAAVIAGAPVASAADPSDTVVVNCLGKQVTEPKQIVVTCGDASVMVMRIDWSSWTANGAKGTGTLTWNTCLPKTCVAGIVETYKVRVTLGRVASAPSSPAFTRMTLAFPDGGPAAAETATYTLDNKAR